MNFIGKHLCWSLLTKLQNSGVFVWIWEIFTNIFFLQNAFVSWFWIFEKCLCSANFSLQLKLCLHLIFFHSYSFATCMVKMSSNIFSYRKKCIMRRLSWNSEKPSSRPEVFCNGKKSSWKFRKIHTSLPESHFLLKLLTERLQLYWKETPVQEISCEFSEIPKNISFIENHRTGQLLLDGNEPGESLVFWGKSFRNASFLTRGRLYFNSSYIFAKSSFGGISHTSKIMPCRTCRRWNKCFQDFSYSTHTECLTICFIVPWQENIKMKMLNFTL